jgi:putative ABC transport system permease protein
VFYQQIAERAAALPGVKGAAVAQTPPLAGGILRSVFPEGVDTTTKDRVLVQVNVVGLGYFQAIGIPIERGRDFARSDTADSPKVVVINQTMAQQFWKDGDPIGRRFKFFGDDAYTTVIGVAKDSKYNAVGEDPQPFIYEPLAQNYTPAAALHVRASTADAAGLAAIVRREVQQIDPTLSLFNIRTLEEQVGLSLQPQKMNVVLLTIFGTLALLLAAIGLYGVASYSVSQRTREIGVRMALGAPRSNVLGLVLGRAMILVGAGLILGLAAAYPVAGLMRALLVGVDARDPITFAATAAGLATVALLASYLPALRATRIDPLIALRSE